MGARPGTEGMRSIAYVGTDVKWQQAACERAQGKCQMQKGLGRKVLQMYANSDTFPCVNKKRNGSMSQERCKR